MQAAKSRNWTAVAVAALCVVATAWPAAAAPWPPADVASDPASPLLAPVDVELELAPPVPAERAEITLALQPPHSWDGLLDLGIPSGESPSLSETRVWGFFLGSTDCVGLKRLQTSDSTGDASFFGRSLRHGVYFARNNPVGFLDPDGQEAKAALLATGDLTNVTLHSAILIFDDDPNISETTVYSNGGQASGVQSLEGYLADYARTTGDTTRQLNLKLEPDQVSELQQNLEGGVNPNTTGDVRLLNENYNALTNNCAQFCQSNIFGAADLSTIEKAFVATAGPTLVTGQLIQKLLALQLVESIEVISSDEELQTERSTAD